MSFLQQKSDHFFLFVKITPNSSQNKIGEIFTDEKDQQYLKINICAVPEDSKANQELIKFLSKTFKIPKSKIEILRGNSSRMKVLKIYEMSISTQVGV
ncbi:MAG: DUF167 domain-containing protein [Rickettsiales bacterium]|nr:DUF167 domain-containing protein [Rickettsiales bacterium]